MLTTERYNLILRMLTQKQTIKIQEIVEATSASESTIRRDLTELEKLGKLVRIFGGATVPSRHANEPSVIDKSSKNLQEKSQLAKYAASVIQDGQCIYLDAGTTIHHMIPFLQDKNVIVVTNGLTHMELLNELGIRTYMTGGYMKRLTGALVGTQAIQSLGTYRFDLCFLGVNGIHATHGYTTPDPEEAAVKYLASGLAQKTYVVADHTKVNTVSFAKIMDIHDAELIVNEIDYETLEVLTKMTDVKVVSS
ncbi:DeoR/GlpR family DNA-binding transcription regulator [Paenisporosarcina sp. NPDC076898]|uniref:DeoR/GlpR family DNA-binding transcription regulator n=1 Tax=unclassified Paenisporosarcina TaxID=2642018 RepID=UPI003CFE83F0